MPTILTVLTGLDGSLVISTNDVLIISLLRIYSGDTVIVTVVLSPFLTFLFPVVTVMPSSGE